MRQAQRAVVLPFLLDAMGAALRQQTGNAALLRRLYVRWAPCLVQPFSLAHPSWPRGGEWGGHEVAIKDYGATGGEGRGEQSHNPR